MNFRTCDSEKRRRGEPLEARREKARPRGANTRTGEVGTDGARININP